MNAFFRSLLVFVLCVCLVHVVTSQHPDSAKPHCTSSSCCNYCDMTYTFPQNDCNSVLNGLAKAANQTSEFALESVIESPPSIYAVHTTRSKCCPPGWKYYEDVTFNMTSISSTSCSAVGLSVSRSGTCDLGNDQVNLEKIVDGSGLTYTGPTIDSGCEN